MVPHLGIWVRDYIILTKTRVSLATKYLVRMWIWVRDYVILPKTRVSFTLQGSGRL